jgi:enoyl-CoA hydratase
MARGPGRMGVPELRVGVPFPSIALEVFRHGCDGRHVRPVVYGGATCDADESLARGMVDEVVAPDALIDRALEHAHDLATLPTRAFTITKHQLRRGAIERAHANRTLFDEAVRTAWSSDDTRRSIRDYIDRTFRK